MENNNEVQLLDAEEYIPQIMLLMANAHADEANAALCLELINVCTAHSFLTGMIVGVFLCSKDKETHSRAYTLLNNKITSDLRRKMTLEIKFSKNPEYEYKHNFLVNHPEIDYCGCIFSCRALLGDNSNYWSLFNVNPNRLGNSFYLKDLPIHTLHLAIDNEKDDEQLAEVFKDFKIKWLHLTIKNAYLPIHILQVRTVKYCHFNRERNFKSTTFPEGNNVLEIPNLLPISDNLKHIFSLNFDDINIKNSSNLSALTYLKSIKFNKSSFENTSFLSKMPLLTRLIINYTDLTTLPPETALLHNLTYLHILGNNIKRIDLDFNNLPNLRDVSIFEEEFNYITDTFYNCTELRSVAFDKYKEGFKLPQSLIDKGFGIK